MSQFEQQTVPSAGQHYSGRNRVPNVREFMDQLDQNKKQRDAQIDQQLKQNNLHGDTKDHKQDRAEAIRNQKDVRTVRDPVTGKDVGIRDADFDYKEAVENPQVCYVNGNGLYRNADLIFA
jgi:hypothetical protein